MAKLTDGSYVAKTERRVVTWKKPDAQGTGEPIWVTAKDSEGRNIGSELLRDQYGNEVRSYPVPEGFRNVPTSGNQDNYVYFEEGKREPYRCPNGDAVNIKPGQAVVFEPDGNVTYLEDEYAQHVFALAHDMTSVSEAVDA